MKIFNTFLLFSALLTTSLLVDSACGSLPLDGASSFDRSLWMDDYASLKTWIANSYVNLDDSVSNHRIDLTKIDEETKTELKNSRSNDEAQHALFKFIEMFHDPHLQLMSDQLIMRHEVRKTMAPHIRKQLSQSEVAALTDRQSDGNIKPDENVNTTTALGTPSGAIDGFNGHQVSISTSNVSISPEVYAEQACTSMGFKKRTFEFRFAYQLNSKAQEREYPSDSFPAMLLKLEDGRRMGIIRLSKFSPKNFFDSCVHEWPAFSKKLRKLMPTARAGGRLPKKGRIANGTCGGECQDKFIEELVENRLIHDFESIVQKLEHDNVSALVIDVTDNNGGGQWETALPHILTDKTLECGSYAISRSPSTLENLQSQKFHYLGQIEMLNNVQNTKGKRAGPEVASHISQLREQIAEADTDMTQMTLKCDRSNIWSDPKITEQCPLTLHRKIAACQTNPVYTFRTGLYHGPLFVLANRNTASVATDFVARLKDSKAATILGETTLGTGCLTRNKGVTTSLANSGLKVYTPDCARFLSSGVNEIVGIDPEVALGMGEMGKPTFLGQLRNAVQTALPARPVRMTTQSKHVESSKSLETESPKTPEQNSKPWERADSVSSAPVEQPPAAAAPAPVDKAPTTAQ